MDIKVINLTFTILCIFFSVMVIKTQTCLYFGKAIASQEYLQLNPNGFQNALTDPSGNKWFFLVVIFLISILIFYLTISWIFLLFGIANIFLMMGLVRLVMPKISSKKNLISISNSLSKRILNFEKNGEHLKSSAAKELLEKLRELEKTY